MKKILLTLSLLVATFYSRAQITLTQANQAPAVGDVFTSYVGDTSTAPGNYGANQTWTMNITLSGTPMVQNFVAPSSTPYGASFPTANVANSFSGSYEYLNSSSSGLAISGAYQAGCTLNYTSTTNMVTYPFTFNSTTTNPSVSGTMSGSPTGTISGSMDAEGDAYGTLIINGVAHPNLLRIKSTQILAYVITGLGTENYTIVTYYWYDGIHHNPVLEISTEDGSGLQTVHQKVVYVADFATGINDPSGSSNLSIYPNPAHGLLNVDFVAESEAQTVISMYSMIGEVVYKKEFEPRGLFRYNEPIDTRNFTPGIYFLQVNSGNRMYCKRVEIN